MLRFGQAPTAEAGIEAVSNRPHLTSASTNAPMTWNAPECRSASTTASQRALMSQPAIPSRDNGNFTPKSLCIRRRHRHHQIPRLCQRRCLPHNRPTRLRRRQQTQTQTWSMSNANLVVCKLLGWMMPSLSRPPQDRVCRRCRPSQHLNRQSPHLLHALGQPPPRDQLSTTKSKQWA